MDVFIILQLRANDFPVTGKGGKQQHYNKLNQIRNRSTWYDQHGMSLQRVKRSVKIFKYQCCCLFNI